MDAGIFMLKITHDDVSKAAMLAWRAKRFSMFSAAGKTCVGRRVLSTTIWGLNRFITKV